MVICNPAAIRILKDNPSRIDWNYLALNPAIFKPIINSSLCATLNDIKYFYGESYETLF